jgi:hypothetical protein
MPALRPAPLSVLVLAVVAAAPAGAGAATLSGEVTDPVDSAGSPAQDITLWTLPTRLDTSITPLWTVRGTRW